MELILTVIFAVIGFGILVFFHELGHFIAAILFKIKVEVFAIGWGPALFKFTIKGVDFKLCAFPIGGFCKFKGDELDENYEKVSEDPDSFYNAKPYKRLIIAFSGPFMNYIIALLFLSFLVMLPHKEIAIPPKIYLVDDYNTKFSNNTTNDKETPAKKYGLKTGDLIIKMNKKEIKSYDQLTKFMFFNGKKPVNIKVNRDDNIIELKVTPEWDPYQLKAILGVYYYQIPVIKYSETNKLIRYLDLRENDIIIGLDNDFEDITDIVVDKYLNQYFASNKIGIIHIKRGDKIIQKEIDFSKINNYISKDELRLDFHYPEVPIKGKNIFAALKDGFVASNEAIAISAIGLYSFIFKPKKNIERQIGGPIKIANIIGTVTISGFKESLIEGIRNFFTIVSYISLALAFFNLLPIPAVDGGHIVLNIYEIIRKKRLSIKVLQRINLIGFAILITLAIVVSIMDVSSFFK
ncbi:MAG TPA: site-2 protease family protein [Spirochaetota bacterium]|mgnify:CR=1 FL=1|nr:site-2 protease family protein [Spirochaetota bacterium]HOL57169.1 site-2 protease family protein [Spirochaetota bacterium]HPP04805.1 site-2 protease family protein [Spirochaetota bacterium]